MDSCTKPIRTLASLFGLFAALSMASLSGCALDASSELSEDDELIETSESDLEINPLSGAPVNLPTAALPEEVQEPEPEPWHPRTDEKHEATDPDEISGRLIATPTGGHHDKN